MSGLAKRQRFYEVVGDAIRRQRETAGMSTCRLAELVGVRPNAIAKAEDGASCTLHLAAQIAEALDVSLDTIVPTEAT